MFTIALTPAEQRVLRVFVEKGQSNKDIAMSIGVSPLTVKTQMKFIMNKAGVSTRTELLAKVKYPERFN